MQTANRTNAQPRFQLVLEVGNIFSLLGRGNGDFFQRFPALPVPQSPTSSCRLNAKTEWDACNVQGEDEMGSEVADLGTFASPASFRGYRQGSDKEGYMERKIVMLVESNKW